MSAVKVDQWLNPDGTENYKCRAWVNFNGIGTVAIRASGNVSSITDNGTGDYTLNFVAPMPDTNYAVSVACQYGEDSTSPSNMVGGIARFTNAQTASACRISTSGASTAAALDQLRVCATIFR